ncbi:MAG: caspase family protein [Planctomycetia bacterium]|nr:caspase family protein [Planctomycetia bacterium]
MKTLRHVLFSVSCVLLCAASASAQKFHALLVADISPAAKWGEYRPNLVDDVGNMHMMLQRGCPENLLKTSFLMLEEDEQATPTKLLEAIEQLRSNRNDTILFYYTGHGGIDDRGSYFDLAGGKLYREQVVNAAKTHGSRLVVLVTDCCNARDDGLSQSFPRAAYIPSPEAYTPLFQSLFIEPTGVVDVNACGPGESAFFSLPPKELSEEYGSLFTKALTKWAEEKNDRRSTWDELLMDVGVRVHLMFREAYPDGIAVAKGAAMQTDQNVFARNYPGMPKDRGIRLGIAVRDDNEGRGAMIVEIVDGSPATKAFDIERESYGPLAKGRRITTMNGRKISGPKEFEAAIKSSPQIMRLTVEGSDLAGHEFLVRLSY